MTTIKKAARNGIWLAVFRLTTQAFSWIITIVVARLLAPEDYGLMAIASIFTGYVEVFSELGLGSAIVQREKITEEELSSNFWFSIFLGLAFGIVSLGLAFPTAWIFGEPRVVPITQLISVLFVIGSFMIVPFNILMRDLKFKEIGMIQLFAVIISSSSMLWMARHGMGVWTLINGTIILRMITVVLIFLVSKWRPSFHFDMSEVRPFLKFGINIAGASSLSYVFQKFDSFIVGKVFGVQLLGYYSFSRQLASIPTDKIVSIINQVSYPLFSRSQSDLKKTQEMFLRITKYIALFVSPLFLGGAFYGDEIVRTILGDKWAPVIFLFKIFCLTQFIVSISYINNVVHTALGFPKRVFYFHLVNSIFMPVSLFWAARYSFNHLSIPWLLVYPGICMGWIYFTLKKLNLHLSTYVLNLANPVMASLLMLGGIKIVQTLLFNQSLAMLNLKVIFATEVVFGAFLYLMFLFFFEREVMIEILNIRKA